MPALPRANLRALTPHDFWSWVQLRDEVLAALPHPDLYVRETDEAMFFAQHLQPHGQGIGVFHNEELIAYALLGMPGAGDADNLGRLVGLPLDQTQAVSHLASCMVRKPWRGHQLQLLLLKLRCALAQAYDRPRCMSMVSLHNHTSRRNMMAQGMWIEWTGMIDGLHRQVMQRDLLGRQRWSQQHSRLIAVDDFDQLCAAADSGFVGVQEIVNGSRRMLRYVRRLPDAESTPLTHGVFPL